MDFAVEAITRTVVLPILCLSPVSISGAVLFYRQHVCFISGKKNFKLQNSIKLPLLINQCKISPQKLDFTCSFECLCHFRDEILFRPRKMGVYMMHYAFGMIRDLKKGGGSVALEYTRENLSLIVAQWNPTFKKVRHSNFLKSFIL